MTQVGNILETSPSSARSFSGFSIPRYTMVPDELFDELMVDLTLAETRIVLYVCRRTFGFKKREDAISLSQMLNGICRKSGEVLDRGTGLSRRALLPALRSLIEKGVIVRKDRVGANGGFQASLYSLNFKPAKEEGVGEKSAPTLEEKIAPPLGAENAPYKKQVSTNSPNNTPSIPQTLCREFYLALGRKVSDQKVQKGEVEMQKLLESGFNEAEIRLAIPFVAAKYPDTQTVQRLPFLIDEALSHEKKKAGEIARREDAERTEDLKRKQVIQESEESRLRFEAFMGIPEGERSSILAKAPRWLSLEHSKVAWASAQYHRLQELNKKKRTPVSFPEDFPSPCVGVERALENEAEA